MFRFHCCFISFLQMNRIKLMGIAIDDVIKMNLRTRFWKRIYTSEADKTSRVKQLDDFDNLISPEPVKTYEDSFQLENAIERLKEFIEKDRAILSKEFWSMRDHLFMCIHFGNGHRSGVSANRLVQKLRKVKQQDGNCIIHVMKHTTIKTSVPD